MKKWYWPLLLSAAAAGVAGLVAVIATLGATLSPETVPAALLAPLCLLPSIALFTVLDWLAPERPWKHAGYLVPVAPFLGYLIVITAQDLAGEIRDLPGAPTLTALVQGFEGA